MKKIKLISFLILIATSLLFVQCTTDPIPGPAGRDGADGIDGEDGANGIDGATGTHRMCRMSQCRNIRKVHASYLFSGHYNENMDHDVDGDGINDPLSQYGNQRFRRVIMYILPYQRWLYRLGGKRVSGSGRLTPCLSRYPNNFMYRLAIRTHTQALILKMKVLTML